MKLYSFWRSSSAYRVRIALNLKGVCYDTCAVDLSAGLQRSDEYLAKNPEGLVPALKLDDGTVLTQSLAIIDWLEALYSKPALMPGDPLRRAKCLAAAQSIAMNIQPMCNSGTAAHLAAYHGFDDERTRAWMVHWLEKGLHSVSQIIDTDTQFCFGDQPGLADICLVPQLYNARRWGADFDGFKRLAEIEAACLALEAFDMARPEMQPDAVR